MFLVLDQMIVPSNRLLEDIFMNLNFLCILVLLNFLVGQAWVCSKLYHTEGNKVKCGICFEYIFLDLPA